MAGEPLIPNRLKDERLAAGIATAEELAVLAGIDPTSYEHIERGRMLPALDELERLLAALGGISASQLYAFAHRGVMGGLRNDETGSDLATMFRTNVDSCHVLLTRDEIAWFDRQPGPDQRADVFVNLSCSTQRLPHLLLDTVAVLRRLGVDFVAVAGTAACCGNPFAVYGRPEVAERVARHAIDGSVGSGASTHVNWCTQCQLRNTTGAARRQHADGMEHPVREVQIITFLEEQIRALGDRVPWQKRPSRRVLVEGHPRFSPVHREAQTATARLLALIPGVEVAELYDGSSEESPCVYKGQEPDWTPPEWYLRRNTPEGVREHRARLADYAERRGADTVAGQHQFCHLDWSAYASDRLDVCHAVSILAEALGCAHPDRRQAAIRLGDPEAFLTQTRSVWQSWGISEDKARELATSISDPNYADAATQCSCSGGTCQESLISVDVLTATSKGA
jgi:transcriptional regulator with XRE-family HTH domain